MTAELTQMRDKKVWHGVSTADLNIRDRRAIRSSKMFLKDKYLASFVATVVISAVCESSYTGGC